MRVLQLPQGALRHASCAYFATKALSNLHPSYHFSLRWFSGVLQQALVSAQRCELLLQPARTAAGWVHQHGQGIHKHPRCCWSAMHCYRVNPSCMLLLLQTRRVRPAVSLVYISPPRATS